MHKEIATLWVDALRSGEYAQTTGTLEITPEYAATRSDEKVGFCCLGVLSILAVEAGVIDRDVDNDGYVSYGSFGNTYTGELPDAAKAWAGMKSSSGDRDNEKYYAGETETFLPSLVLLNDSRKLTFAEIADVIEAEYETL